MQFSPNDSDLSYKIVQISLYFIKNILWEYFILFHTFIVFQNNFSHKFPVTRKLTVRKNLICNHEMTLETKVTSFEGHRGHFTSLFVHRYEKNWSWWWVIKRTIHYIFTNSSVQFSNQKKSLAGTINITAAM